MKSAHVLCAIEAFELRPTGAGGDARELHLEGWYLSNAPTNAMHLVLSGDPETVIEITDHGRQSDGVFLHHGADFGDHARNARFLLRRPVPEGGFDLSDARLRVASGDAVLEHRLDPA